VGVTGKYEHAKWEVRSMSEAELNEYRANLWPTTPADMVEVATSQANVLADIITEKGMSTSIGRGKGARQHINIEGWQTLGAMTGIFAVVEWTRELVDDEGNQQGWEARATATTADGRVVGAAEAECRRSEATWAKRDSYALRSMAQTRAMSKALRGPLGFIVHIAGYSATPEEEMTAAKSAKQLFQEAVLEAADGDRDRAKDAIGVLAAKVGLDSPKDFTDDTMTEALGHLAEVFDIEVVEAELVEEDDGD
jgi:hypothetical protein